ncbi:MAG: hypothetical protein K9M98_06375 [Cephaloticoccus sp.]|nr:hypothetical protein [Cephaloticoccus sp.]MCF7760112.1 hypothetical protein [Cephaloticoccus sp.]
MKPLRKERVAAGLALGLLIVSATGFGLKLVGEVQPGFSPAMSSQEGYSRQVNAATPSPTANWPVPEAQSRGEEWVYDVFTPPHIFYDATTQRFRVTPAFGQIARPGQLPKSQGFGLELQEVRRAKFPLQLIGYVGEPGHFLGTFANLETYETLLLTTADRVESLGLCIDKLEVQMVAVKIPDSMSVNDYRVSAIVRDLRTGQITNLQQGETQYSDALLATVTFSAGNEPPRDVSVGDTLTRGEDHFIIEKIRLAPPSVDVTKEQPGRAAQEHHTLNPSISPVQFLP